jgi:hypothetical protein
VRVVKITVPLSCCDDAADYLIKALGGEEVAKRVAGGTKWWQVRGLKGYAFSRFSSVLWSDMDEGFLRNGSPPRRTGAKQNSDTRLENRVQTRQTLPKITVNINRRWTSSAVFFTFMEVCSMGCLSSSFSLYAGGYYFGSVDQERYSIQRFARKINGRVFGLFLYFPFHVVHSRPKYSCKL